MEALFSTSKRKLLLEVAWEVCNQVGGIYTVIRSKVPAMVEKWDDNYVLLGPYFPQKAAAEYEPITEPDETEIGQTVRKMRQLGYEVEYGYWLVTGRPRVVLFNLQSMTSQLDALKAGLWERHKLPTLGVEDLVNQTLAFGEMVRVFIKLLADDHARRVDMAAHFHEWMAASGLPELRRENVKVATVFTTHATMLGRYLAQNETNFYGRLDSFDWQKEARHYGIEAQATIERLAALQSHVFTTVSDVTARECEVFLGRNPDLILPNGLNVTRFAAAHEFQNLHVRYKERIHEFVMGHFFQNYSFDLDKTLYFFTSGRFEFSNKGYDLTLEALARLNWRMREANMDITVVMFMVTKQPYRSINPEVLHTRALLDEIRETSQAIEKQVGERLFLASASGSETSLPDLNKFVDEYWRLRLRRTVQSWKTKQLPRFVTHDLLQEDDMTRFIRQANLVNNEYDRVKIVYHPDFIASTNPLFGLDYSQFVRGCHLGIFPSYYEPWGYTPLECVVRGIPTVTSDQSGFGDFIMQIMRDYENRGIYVVNRKTQNFDEAANQLADILYRFVRMSMRDRIQQRNRVESISDVFDWTNLRSYYDTAHDLALKRRKP
ncbi:Glycogen(starch) synthase [Fibrella aestuarina BUZ 2]|uniref:Glycogen(Starch) synthase n=1 Tax=Fibrella aestuarina BUZ 2 TaxID=1166018 RepID=I0K534_9BACT|nr:glycosyltransferase [Fibrella aestuarina]CCG99237.1 Glycogen(starch) synthase [Fibrella aestuarina BUZ 2]